MQLKTYNTEYFERNKLWYIIFAICCIAIFTMTIYYKNWVGSVLLLFLLWGYFYFGIAWVNEVFMTIWDNGLSIDKKIFAWSEISGFVLEYEEKTKQIKNIVILHNNTNSIYTIVDDQKPLHDFIESLSQRIPMVSTYEQSFFEKLSRKLKL